MAKKNIIVRSIPSGITFINLIMGFFSILYTLEDKFNIAALLILGACVFDVLDGLVARKFGLISKMGVELDSLADATSFVIAPSLLIYADLAGYFWTAPFISVFLAVMGIFRLAKFNVTEYHKSFLGMPTPAFAAIACFFVLTNTILSEWALMIFFLIVGILMVSNIKFPNFKDEAFMKYKYMGILIFSAVVVAFLWGLDLFSIVLIENISLRFFLIILLYFSKLVKRKVFMLIFMFGLLIITVLAYSSPKALLMLVLLYSVIASPLLQASFEQKKIQKNTQKKRDKK